MDKMGYLGNKGMINFRTQNSRAKRVKANSFDINEYQVPIFQKCIDKNIFFIRNIFFIKKVFFFFIFQKCIFQQYKRRLTHGHNQMVNTQIRLIIFFAAKDGDIFCLYSQQNQDGELSVVQIMNSLLKNSDFY